MSETICPAELEGRVVTVVGLSGLYRVLGEWRGYLRLEDVHARTTVCETPGRVLDDVTGRWWAELVEQCARFADYAAAKRDLLEAYAEARGIEGEP